MHEGVQRARHVDDLDFPAVVVRQNVPGGDFVVVQDHITRAWRRYQHATESFMPAPAPALFKSVLHVGACPGSTKCLWGSTHPHIYDPGKDMMHLEQPFQSGWKIQTNSKAPTSYGPSNVGECC